MPTEKPKVDIRAELEDELLTGRMLDYIYTSAILDAVQNGNASGIQDMLHNIADREDIDLSQSQDDAKYAEGCRNFFLKYLEEKEIIKKTENGYILSADQTKQQEYIDTRYIIERKIKEIEDIERTARAANKIRETVQTAASIGSPFLGAVSNLAQGAGKQAIVEAVEQVGLRIPGIVHFVSNLPDGMASFAEKACKFAMNVHGGFTDELKEYAADLAKESAGAVVDAVEQRKTAKENAEKEAPWEPVEGKRFEENTQKHQEKLFKKTLKQDMSGIESAQGCAYFMQDILNGKAKQFYKNMLDIDRLVDCKDLKVSMDDISDAAKQKAYKAHFWNKIPGLTSLASGTSEVIHAITIDQFGQASMGLINRLRKDKPKYLNDRTALALETALCKVNSAFLKIKEKSKTKHLFSYEIVNEQTLDEQMPVRTMENRHICNALSNAIEDAHKILTESRENERDFELE